MTINDLRDYIDNGYQYNWVTEQFEKKEGLPVKVPKEDISALISWGQK
jgi:hypothetical protein